MFESAIVELNEPLIFEVKETGKGQFEGIATTTDGTEVKKTLKVNSDTYSIAMDVEVTFGGGRKGTIRHSLVEPLRENASSSFFMPSYNHQDVFVIHGTTDDRIVVNPEQAVEDSFQQVKLASLGGSYFMSSLVDNSEVLPSFLGKVDLAEKQIYGHLDHQSLSAGVPLKLSMIGYVGPKQLDLMDAVDPRLRESVDFGWFSIIGFFLLKLLNVLYSFIPNYGVAIVILTIIVRMLVLPFNISSYRSMKKMQTINPLLKSVREKYKNEPQTLNAETMRIMKENKVNPLGGCLPMIIQLPIFISLYRVFGQSIELYHAPFVLWIKDLSVKDPYYVLPVLMGLTMFIQQKVTPTTMDPAQAKVMAFLPLVFSFFMLSLPSSLTLYIFVSTLFGVAQQMVFLRDTQVVAHTSTPQVKA
jgi:YidC/Oxa1 family membrane protein insertase